MGGFNFELGSLASPKSYCSSLQVSGFSSEFLRTCFEKMFIIRKVEEAIAQLVVDGYAKTPCHLGVGQEAIPVGVSSVLTRTDRVFSAHRAHGHYLALGGDEYKLIAEVLGKLDGCSKGMGGSMHIVDRSVGFFGSVPIVGATIPLAVGAGLAAKLQDSSDIGVAYFGDGACEEGVLHESLNLASVQNIPVLFVCENNLFASHLDIKARQPSDCVARFAAANGVDFEVVDGNDVLAVYCAARKLVELARRESRPVFLEAVTYRWRGHVGPNEDIDVGVRRSVDELSAWKERDPIARLERALVDQGVCSSDYLCATKEKWRSVIGSAVEKAIKAGYPPIENLFDTVYAKSRM